MQGGYYKVSGLSTFAIFVESCGEKLTRLHDGDSGGWKVSTMQSNGTKLERISKKEALLINKKYRLHVGIDK